MRNAAPRHERFTQARQWELIYGGTESNVAVALSHFGVDAAFVTAFPPNELGQAAANYVRQYGVDTSKIIWRGDRLGLYFLETGASVRPSKVVYDRKGSAFSELRPGDHRLADSLRRRGLVPFHWYLRGCVGVGGSGVRGGNRRRAGSRIDR